MSFLSCARGWLQTQKQGRSRFDKNSNRYGRSFARVARSARTQAFPLLERLETRELLSAIVTTDQPDYAPRSTALITATSDGGRDHNFQVGETVQFHIDRTDGGTVQAPPAIQTWDVTDGDGGFTPYQDYKGMWWFPDTDGQADGSIGTSWYVDSQFAGASLRLTATGQSSGEVATTTFTDGTTTVDTVTVGSQTGSVNYGTGGAVTFSVAVTTSTTGGGGHPTVSLSVSGLPSGVSGAFLTNPLPFTGGSTTLTLTTTPAIFAGSFSFTVTANATNSVNQTGTLSVNKRPITVTAASNIKTYDGNTSAAGVPTITSGSLATGDTATFTETYNIKSAGTGKTLTPAGTVNDGDSGNNYAYTFVTNTTGVIDQAALTITATGVNKVYDATAAATANLSDNRVTGDSLTDSYASAFFADKNVSTDKAVSITGISISGADAGNYTFNTTASTTANITARTLVVSATGINKVYNGDMTATVMLSDNRVSGDVFTDSYTMPLLSDKNVGTSKTVSVSGISISGRRRQLLRQHHRHDHRRHHAPGDHRRHHGLQPRL